MMKIIKYPFYILYRIWFYILVAVPIIILFPVLLVLSSKESLYPQFFWVARNVWANIILYGMGVPPKIRYQQQLQKHSSYMLVANHTSMLDIMMMLKVAKSPFVFVGKKELASIPVFGFFYKRVCILVDRNSAKSRGAVYSRAKERLSNGLSICIFPEGGVPDDESVVLDAFKDGAFRLAIEYQIPIVPITFLDNKKRFSYTFFSGSMGVTRAISHTLIPTENLNEKDKVTLREQARNVIYNALSTS